MEFLYFAICIIVIIYLAYLINICMKFISLFEIKEEEGGPVFYATIVPKELKKN